MQLVCITKACIHLYTQDVHILTKTTRRHTAATAWHTCVHIYAQAHTCVKLRCTHACTISTYRHTYMHMHACMKSYLCKYTLYRVHEFLYIFVFIQLSSYLAVYPASCL